MLFFVVIPVARSLLARPLLPPHHANADSLLGSLASNLDVFDSQQLRHVASQTHPGYTSEVNHAFYPLVPWLLNGLSTLLHDELMLFVPSGYQLLISYCNTLLLSKVAHCVFAHLPPKPRHKLATLSAYLYICSHSLLYQMSPFYSENTFLFTTLLALRTLYSKDQSPL